MRKLRQSHSTNLHCFPFSRTCTGVPGRWVIGAPLSSLPKPRTLQSFPQSKARHPGKNGWRVVLAHKDGGAGGLRGRRARDRSEVSNLECYWCGGLGHLAYECPLRVGAGGLDGARRRSRSPRYRTSPSYDRRSYGPRDISPERRTNSSSDLSPRRRTNSPLDRFPRRRTHSPRDRSPRCRSYSPRHNSPRRRSVSPRGRSYSKSPPHQHPGDEPPYADGYRASPPHQHHCDESPCANGWPELPRSSASTDERRSRS